MSYKLCVGALQIEQTYCDNPLSVALHTVQVEFRTKWERGEVGTGRLAMISHTISQKNISHVQNLFLNLPWPHEACAPRVNLNGGTLACSNTEEMGLRSCLDL